MQKNATDPLESTAPCLTEFEREVERLGLRSEDYVLSVELRRWCERNRDRVYIPEWLLDEWGMTISVA